MANNEIGYGQILGRYTLVLPRPIHECSMREVLESYKQAIHNVAETERKNLLALENRIQENESDRRTCRTKLSELSDKECDVVRLLQVQA